MIRWFVIVATCGLALGCGDSPTSPSYADVSGTWQGTIGAGADRPAIRLTLSQAGQDVSGTWATSQASATTGGLVGGQANGSALSLTLRDQTMSSQCVLNVTVTVTGTRMTGTYAALNCPESAGGGVDLTKV